MARTKKEAADDFFPGTRARSRASRKSGDGPRPAPVSMRSGAGGRAAHRRADEVAEKILRHSETLGGISRITFQMNAASLPQDKMLRAIEMFGARVAPSVREET